MNTCYYIQYLRKYRYELGSYAHKWKIAVPANVPSA